MKLHYQSTGIGRPLVILHGLFGSSDNWRSIVKVLVNTRQVITVDLRNHGQSPHSTEQSYPLMVEDLFELLDDLDLDKVDLIGHSVGGKVAMAFSQTYPDRINKLIVVDIAPRQYQPEHTAIFKALLALDLSLYTQRSDLDQALALSLPDKAVRQFLLMNLNNQNQQLHWQINLPALFDNYQALLAAVCEQGKVYSTSLFIRGGRSNYINVDDETLIKKTFSNSSLVTIEQAGHWVHAEAPQAFITTVSEFLDD